MEEVIKEVNYLKCKNMLIIITLYMFANIFLIVKNNTIYTNIINPLFWCLIIIYLFFYMKNCYIRNSGNRKYLINIVIISCIQVIVYFYLGFIFGFAKNPYYNNIIKNIFIYIIPIIGMEMTRGILVIQNKSNKFVIIFLTIILFLININYSVILNLSYSKEHLFQYICSYIFPSISVNILYTYLSIIGSYFLSMTLRLIYRLILILLPILPNTDWFVTGSLGTLSPFIIYVIFKFKLTKEKNVAKKKHCIFYNAFSKISYIVTLILAITLICFMLGVFKYEPIVILSNSMNTIFCRGDAVIYKKLTDSELKQIPVYSIIVYTIGKQNVAHRIISITKENDTVFYQTKGDSNNVPDTHLVSPNQIKGVYLFHIKYIGFPSVWLYDYFNSEK